MAAPVKISEDAILDAALELVRDRGFDALNARALAKALSCSTQPIFKNYSSMEVLRRAVLERALERYHGFVADYMAASQEPPYKAAGLAYVEFARKEPALFRLLFMRSRRAGEQSPEAVDWPDHTALAGTATGLSGPATERFHLEMWAVVHGLAVMLATGYLDLDAETVSRVLSDVFLGVKYKWEGSYERN